MTTGKRKGSETMSIQEYVRSYTSQVSEQETRFRDLFGKEELEEARKKSFTQNKSYLQYLKEETERKLREQDGN
jgi:hypothetical protein